MKTELVQATPSPIKMMADIASICYGHEEAKNPSQLVSHLNKLGHRSVFEHVYFTFKIEGISRACLAQLTRHRHASYTVRSQRYCNEKDAEFIVPENIENDEDARRVFHTTIAIINSSYENLIDSGIKREDARSILPQSTSTDLYMSLNLRELMHIYSLRTDKSAQDEIRNLAIEMVTRVKEALPELKELLEEEV